MHKGEPRATATNVLAARYPEARIAFLAGSVVRGEATQTSDLDLVVIFDRLPHAYRESFVFEGWAIEAFVHDPQTLRYFCREVDRLRGVPSLPAMVIEGIELPGPDDLSASLKRHAQQILDGGPPRWGDKEIAESRYAITDLIDDMRDPRSRHELTASATMLYPLVADHYLRSRQLWSARGKAIPRRLSRISPGFAAAFCAAFQEVFEAGNIAALVALCEEVLAPDGGWLFEGHVLHASLTQRLFDE